MATLLIRNVDDDLHTRLKARAAAHHRSLEEEVRTLLRTGLARTETKAPREDLVSLTRRLFGPLGGVDLELPLRSSALERPPPDLSDL